MHSTGTLLELRRADLARRILDAEALIIELREELDATDRLIAVARNVTTLRPSLIPVAFPECTRS